MNQSLNEHVERKYDLKMRQLPITLMEYYQNGVIVYEKQNNNEGNIELNHNLSEAIFELLSNKNITLMNKSYSRNLSNISSDHILVECYIIKKLVEFVHTDHKCLSGNENHVRDVFCNYGVDGLINLFNRGEVEKFEMIKIFIKQQFQNEATSSIDYDRKSINQQIDETYLNNYKVAYIGKQENQKNSSSKGSKKKFRSLF